MTENFTTEDTRTINEMLDDYENLKAQIDGIDYDNTADKEQELINEYKEYEEFLISVREALDFTKASTSESLSHESDNTYITECKSLYDSAEDYADAVVLLTGGFDKRMNAALEETRTEDFSSPFIQSLNEYRQITSAPLANSRIKESIKDIIGTDNIADTKTVSDLVDKVDFVREMWEKYDISNEDVINDTLYAFFTSDESEKTNTLSIEAHDWKGNDIISAETVSVMYDAGYRSEDMQKIEEDFAMLNSSQLTAVNVMLKTFEEQELTKETITSVNKELQEKEVPVIVMESIDGFAVSPPERTAANEKDFDRQIKADGETREHVHTETTHDRREVKGNVKLEEVNELSTLDVEHNVKTKQEEQEEKTEKETDSYTETSSKRTSKSTIERD